jgi:hypothetical protein
MPGWLIAPTGIVANNTSAILKITLHERAEALCRLAEDEGLSQPFRIKFKDQNRLHSRVAELWIRGAEVWVKEPQAIHFELANFRYAHECRWSRDYAGNVRIDLPREITVSGSRLTQMMSDI